MPPAFLRDIDACAALSTHISILLTIFPFPSSKVAFVITKATSLLATHTSREMMDIAVRQNTTAILSRQKRTRPAKSL
jgi:hypothetical protein